MTIDVHHSAREFAQELQDLLDGTLPRRWNVDEDDRRVQVLAADNDRYVIRLAQAQRQLELTRDGKVHAYLRIEYQCTHDTQHDYLAVQRSTYELLSSRDRTPLARLDFLRNAHTVPACHWNIQAERGAVSNLLARTNPDHAGLVSKLHFTVGGARMRPSLEDFIDIMAYEFRFDLRAGARELLENGRERWRRRQVGALVRDAPDEAVRVLEQLGYQVQLPAVGPAAPNVAALRRR